jgi:hypothetical protein
MDKLNIRLHVYDADIAVKIDPEDEVYYRKAAKLITDTVNTYAEIFKGDRSEKEILYMSLIDIALRYEKSLERNDTVPFVNVLGQLTSEMEAVLPGTKSDS